MTPQKRLEALMRAAHLTKTELAQLAGYNRPQTIYDVCNEKTRVISADLARRLVLAIPELSYDWLVSGDGEMFTAPFSGVKRSEAQQGTINGRGRAFKSASVQVTNHFGTDDLAQLAQSVARLTQSLETSLRQQDKLIDIIAKLSPSTDTAE